MAQVGRGDPTITRPTSDDWATPGWIKVVFGGWFDPCPLFPTFDGLEEPWQSPTFANIPYSNPTPWIEKAIAEAERGVRVVLLLRVDTSTRWWTRLLESGARIACFQGRISFDGGKRPYFASALAFLLRSGFPSRNETEGEK